MTQISKGSLFLTTKLELYEMCFDFMSRLAWHALLDEFITTTLTIKFLWPASSGGLMFIFLKVNTSIKARDTSQIEGVEIMEFQAHLSLHTLYQVTFNSYC